MKEIMFKAVEQHVAMCDDLVEDLVDGLIESEESIKASQKLLGIEMDFSIDVAPESKMLLDDYNSRQLAKLSDSQGANEKQGAI